MIPGATVDWAQDCPFLRIVRSIFLLPRGGSSPLRSATPARMGSCRRARMRRDSCVMVRVGSSICAVHTTQNRENQSNQRNRGNQDNQENQATQENKKIHKKLVVVDWLVFLVVLGCLGFPETQET